MPGATLRISKTYDRGHHYHDRAYPGLSARLVLKHKGRSVSAKLPIKELETEPYWRYDGVGVKQHRKSFTIWSRATTEHGDWMIKTRSFFLTERNGVPKVNTKPIETYANGEITLPH